MPVLPPPPGPDATEEEWQEVFDEMGEILDRQLSGLRVAAIAVLVLAVTFVVVAMARLPW